MVNGECLRQIIKIESRIARMVVRQELTTDNSQLITDNSQLTTDNSKLTTHNSKLTTQNSKLTTQNSQLTNSNYSFALSVTQRPSREMSGFYF